jgi:tRNA dimethylallyltransferase
VKKSASKIIVITGPTASGKTALAIKLAKKIDAEIICADSRIVYRGLDIVSAKPDIIEQDGVPHHLIDIKDPVGEPYSAGDFANDAKAVIEKIKEKNKPVIIAGGTWFYIKCLLDEKQLPEISADKELRDELEKYDNDTLWNMLKKIDPARAEEIHKNNKERVIRAIEMVKTLGDSVSSAERKTNDYDSIWFSNDFIEEKNRDALYKRIDSRVEIMVQNGLYYEWERAVKKYSRNEVLENTIGFREFFELQDGIYEDLNDAIKKIKQRTRNFAKRQITFFRSENKINIIKNEDEIIKFL